MSRSRNLSKLLNNNSPIFEGTGALKIPGGTTAERPTAQLGMVRYNSTLGKNEVYDSEGWAAIASPPQITSVSPSTYNGEQGTAFTITGAFFDSGATVKFITNSGSEYSAATVSRASASQLTATTPQDFTIADEPLKVKVINSSGLAYTLDAAIDCGGSPTWNTASGTIATILDEYGSYSNITTLSASDPDMGATVSFSLASGSLPAGVSLNSSGVISGNPNNVNVQTTSNFIVAAVDNAGNQTQRSFSIIVNPALDGTNSSRAAISASALQTLVGNPTNGNYFINVNGTPVECYVDFTTFAGGPYLLAMVFSSSSGYTYDNAVWTNTSGGSTSALNPSTNSDQLSSIFYTLSTNRTGMALFGNSAAYFNYTDHTNATPRALANGAQAISVSTPNGTVIAANSLVPNGTQSRAGGWTAGASTAGYVGSFGSTYFRHGWQHGTPEPAGYGYARFGFTSDQDSSDSRDRGLGLGIRNLSDGPVGAFNTGAGFFNWDNGNKGSTQAWLYIKN
jgi:hypothetical protein